MSQASINTREGVEETQDRENRRLSSWKEIAAYFGHDQRTVKRWEHSRGLPVRRLPGSRGHVFALVSEVEAWQRGEFAEEPVTEISDRMTESVLHVDIVAAREEINEQIGPDYVAAVANVPYDSTNVPLNVPLVDMVPHRITGRPDERKRNAMRRSWTVAALAVGCAAVLLAVSLPSLRRHPVRTEQHPAYVPSPKARELYLQGRFRWSRRTSDDLKVAMEDFQEALKVDPSYAAAYAGIADAYALGPQFADQYPAKVLPQMLQMAHKALALDPNLPEGHRALAFADFYWRWDREGSKAEFEKAIALAPQDAVTHLWYANTLAAEGIADQALNEVERARELDPTEPAIVADRGWVLMKAGKLPEARAVLEPLEITNPENRMAPLWLSGIALQEHRPEEFLAQLAINARLCGSAATRERLAVAQHGFRAGGEKGMREAMARLAVSQADKGELSPYDAAQELVADGRADEAIPYLEKTLAAHDVSAQALLNSREFPVLNGSRAFQALLKRLGKPLPDAGA